MGEGETKKSVWGKIKLRKISYSLRRWLWKALGFFPKITVRGFEGELLGGTEGRLKLFLAWLTLRLPD